MSTNVWKVYMVVIPTPFVITLMSIRNITGQFLGAQDGNVTTGTENILNCQQGTSGGFLFVKAKYNK